VVDKKKIYETTVIINPTLEEHQIESIVKNVEEMITKNGGSVKSVERWGRKRLSYPINKRNNGYYAHVEFEAEGNLVVDLERIFEYDENIMRYLTIRLDQKAIQAKEAQKLKPRDPETEDLEVIDDIVIIDSDDDDGEPISKDMDS
jgi:small subunit ribosomal protein S6